MKQSRSLFATLFIAFVIGTTNSYSQQGQGNNNNQGQGVNSN